MAAPLNIGIIGLDTPHAAAFAALLNDDSHPHHVTGGKVVAAFRGGSPDMELSASRVDGFAGEIQDKYGVRLVGSPEDVAEQCDAILLESVDGRVHPALFRRIAPYGKPVFIDKPFAVSYTDALDMVGQAERYRVPLMSTSSVRFAEQFTRALEHSGSEGDVTGVDFYGTMPLQPTQPGLFWYGVHAVDVIYRALGQGCEEVATMTSRDHDAVIGRWRDGRIAVIRGTRTGNQSRGGVIHRENGSVFFDVYAGGKPYFASTLERIMAFFQHGDISVPIAETLEVIRFIEAANRSRELGGFVTLRE